MNLDIKYPAGSLKVTFPAASLMFGGAFVRTSERAYVLPDNAEGVLAANPLTGVATLVDVNSTALVSPFVAVYVASTDDISLTTVPGMIDGIQVGSVPGTGVGTGPMRVGLYGQANPSQNGNYWLTNVGTPIDVTVVLFANIIVTGLIPNRVYWVGVTDAGMTATGLNGSVVPLASQGLTGYVSTTAEGTLAFYGGPVGGTASYLPATLARVADADADAEFTTGKPVLAGNGSNNGVWRVGTVGSNVISVPAPIRFVKAGGLPLSGLSADFVFLDHVVTREGRVVSHFPLLNSPTRAAF